MPLSHQGINSLLLKLLDFQYASQINLDCVAVELVDRQKFSSETRQRGIMTRLER
jgi:hypothetical protein